MEEFGYSRGTIRRSIEILRDEGKVSPEQGFGTVINPRE